MVFKNFFHTIRRFYASSLLNIIGLAVAFATAYLILVQVNYDLNYNQSIPDKDRMFILETQSNYDQSKYMSWLSRYIIIGSKKLLFYSHCYALQIIVLTDELSEFNINKSVSLSRFCFEL